MVLIVQGVIAILCAAIGAFAGEYLRTRGKNFATKADFEMLQHQLEKQTKLVETVRTEVSQKDWMKREWLNLRRIKLEALVEKLNDVDEYLEKSRVAALHGESYHGRDIIGELTSIATLYFPELVKQVTALAVLARQRTIGDAELVKDLIQAGMDMTARERAFGKYQKLLTPEVVQADAKLKEPAHRLLLEMMGVAPGS
jgi:hypothetical protein